MIQLFPLYNTHIVRFRVAWTVAWRSVLSIDEWGYQGDGNAATRFPLRYNIRWGRVFVPFTALVATLAQYWWFASPMDKWYRPDGFGYAPRKEADINKFIEHVCSTVFLHIWAKGRSGCEQGGGAVRPQNRQHS